jgi:hypothetical protein
MAVAYSSSSQEATMQRVQEDSNKTPPSVSSVTPKSSVKRQIAAATPSPPKIVTAPSNLFDNAHKHSDNIFLTPPVAAAKWDRINNRTLPTVKQPGWDDDCREMIPGGLTNMLKRQQKKIDRAE